MQLGTTLKRNSLSKSNIWDALGQRLGASVDIPPVLLNCSVKTLYYESDFRGSVHTFTEDSQNSGGNLGSYFQPDSD